MLTWKSDPSISTRLVQLPTLHCEAEASRLFSSARKKLLAEGVPMQLKAVAYVRLCCSALGTLIATIQPIGRDSDPDGITEQSFSTLLTQLCRYSPTWWQHCWVSDRGILHSHQAEIELRLQGLGYFVEMYADHHPAQDYAALSTIWKAS